MPERKRNDELGCAIENSLLWTLFFLIQDFRISTCLVWLSCMALVSSNPNLLYFWGLITLLIWQISRLEFSQNIQRRWKKEGGVRMP